MAVGGSRPASAMTGSAWCSTVERALGVQCNLSFASGTGWPSDEVSIHIREWGAVQPEEARRQGREAFQFTFVSGVPCNMSESSDPRPIPEFQFTFVSGVPCNTDEARRGIDKQIVSIHIREWGAVQPQVQRWFCSCSGTVFQFTFVSGVPCNRRKFVPPLTKVSIHIREWGAVQHLDDNIRNLCGAAVSIHIREWGAVQRWQGPLRPVSRPLRPVSRPLVFQFTFVSGVPCNPGGFSDLVTRGNVSLLQTLATSIGARVPELAVLVASGLVRWATHPRCHCVIKLPPPPAAKGRDFLVFRVPPSRGLARGARLVRLFRRCSSSLGIVGRRRSNRWRCR